MYALKVDLFSEKKNQTLLATITNCQTTRAEFADNLTGIFL